VGQEVTVGQKVGEIGSTGHSTGPHLHYEVRKDGKAVNPVNFLNLN
jgi:murein DD-endopeptidase MepM/ murein hydrolase activator NlpD